MPSWLTTLLSIPKVIEALSKLILWAEKLISEYKAEQKRKELDKALGNADKGDQRDLERVFRRRN